MPLSPNSNDYIRRHKRGYLPHFDSPQLTQFVTFRLADSLPADFVKTLKRKLDEGAITEVEYHREMDKFLDFGRGEAFLKHPEVARAVSNSILHFADERYELRNWVVMPNHVHLLLKTIDPHSLSAVMHSIKGHSASVANKLLGRCGRFWSPDYFDRFIRDRRHNARVMRYIDENPVKAGLCATPEDWPWGRRGWNG
jgi:REP element-mobilizing transposase RayT